jgi:hypothetical protein
VSSKWSSKPDWPGTGSVFAMSMRPKPWWKFGVPSRGATASSPGIQDAPLTSVALRSAALGSGQPRNRT